MECWLESLVPDGGLKRRGGLGDDVKVHLQPLKDLKMELVESLARLFWILLSPSLLSMPYCHFANASPFSALHYRAILSDMYVRSFRMNLRGDCRYYWLGHMPIRGS